MTSGFARWKKRKRSLLTFHKIASYANSKRPRTQESLAHSDGRVVTEIRLSRLLLALSEGEVAALATSMRQIGMDTPSGAEALAIIHQLLYDEWTTGSLGVRWPES